MAEVIHICGKLLGRHIYAGLYIRVVNALTFQEGRMVNQNQYLWRIEEVGVAAAGVPGADARK